jgi:low affinity Fe/Cu permease
MSNKRAATGTLAKRKQARNVHGEHLKRARFAGHSGRHGGPFRRFARAASSAVGRPWAFVGATLTVVVWATLGPIFHYSDTWQLVINTGTTIITFLMVFLIQNTQNRDTEALRLKLDELILATQDARNAFVDIDDLDDDQLAQLEKDLRRVAESRGDENGHAPLPQVNLPEASGSEAKH